MQGIDLVPEVLASWRKAAASEVAGDPAKHSRPTMGALSSATVIVVSLEQTEVTRKGVGS